MPKKGRSASWRASARHALAVAHPVVHVGTGRLRINAEKKKGPVKDEALERDCARAGSQRQALSVGVPSAWRYTNTQKRSTK